MFGGYLLAQVQWSAPGTVPGCAVWVLRSGKFRVADCARCGEIWCGRDVEEGWDGLDNGYGDMQRDRGRSIRDEGEPDSYRCSLLCHDSKRTL